MARSSAVSNIYQHTKSCLARSMPHPFNNSASPLHKCTPEPHIPGEASPDERHTPHSSHSRPNLPFIPGVHQPFPQGSCTHSTHAQQRPMAVDGPSRWQPQHLPAHAMCSKCSSTSRLSVIAALLMTQAAVRTWPPAAAGGASAEPHTASCLHPWACRSWLQQHEPLNLGLHS